MITIITWLVSFDSQPPFWSFLISTFFVSCSFIYKKRDTFLKQGQWNISYSGGQCSKKKAINVGFGFFSNLHVYQCLSFYIKRTVACSLHCQVLKLADFLLPFTPVTNPCYEGLVITKGNVQLLLSVFCTLHGVMYELETFKNVREV